MLKLLPSSNGRMRRLEQQQQQPVSPSRCLMGGKTIDPSRSGATPPGVSNRSEEKMT
jgi:hypothetical protein